MNDTDTSNPPVIEADIVADEVEERTEVASPDPEVSVELSQTNDTESATDPNAATVMLDLESLIKAHITGVDKRRKELKQQKEMLNDIFNNDAAYRAADDKVKEVNKEKSAIKAQLKHQPNAQGLNEKVESLSTEIKEMEQALSDYLREFQRMSGSNEIEGDDGEIREIIYIAKLIKKSSYR